MSLAGDGSGEVGGDVSGLREVDRVPAHLSHDILPEVKRGVKGQINQCGRMWTIPDFAGSGIGFKH